MTNGILIVVNIPTRVRILGSEMGKVTLSNLVSNRQYTELEERAGDYIERDDWRGFLKLIQQASSKTRDAVVNL